MNEAVGLFFCFCGFVLLFAWTCVFPALGFAWVMGWLT